MTSEEIKEECLTLYETIHRAKDRLSELREICKHKNTYEGKYSWRVGAIDDALICFDCGKPITVLNYKLPE